MIDFMEHGSCNINAHSCCQLWVWDYTAVLDHFSPLEYLLFKNSILNSSFLIFFGNTLSGNQNLGGKNVIEKCSLSVPYCKQYF